MQDQSIPLNREFIQSANQFNVKRPTWRLSDSVYQQTLQSPRDHYEITGTKTGWGKSEQSNLWFSESGISLQGVEIKDKFLRFLFLDLLEMRQKSSRRYLLKSENDFAFSVNTSSDDMAQVRCRMLSMNDNLETVYKMDRDKTQRDTKATRLTNYLSCDIQKADKHWYVIVDTPSNETPRIKLIEDGQQASKVLQFTWIKDSSYLLNGEWRTLPINFQKFSGLKIERENQTISALSFDGQHPKIWIGTQLVAEEKTILVAMSYSLMIYDWIDSSWRSAQ
ncbi:MAG: hypothetical protein ACEQSE_10395 [Candidatus Aquirickettsiella gammari]